VLQIVRRNPRHLIVVGLRPKEAERLAINITDVDWSLLVHRGSPFKIAEVLTHSPCCTAKLNDAAPSL
jgi:hypothetical protein